LTIKSFILALQFLTIITIVPRLEVSKEEFKGALAYFPVVGLILGALIAAIYWALSPMLEPEPLAALLAVGLAFLTRSLHLDGLCDTADAIGSRAEPSRALQIMKDSAAGSLGVVAVVSVLLLKTMSMVTICRHGAWQFLILVPCLSRWSLVGLASMSRYARQSDGLGTPFCGRGNYPAVIIAALSSLAAAWFLLQVLGLYLFGASVVMSVVSAAYFRARFGGVTGDCLGAHLESVETILFVAGAALWTQIG